jgi:hypothetical protein
MKDISIEILSDITVYMKYARYLKNKKRRETWREIVTRNKNMHKKKFPELASEIDSVYELVYDKKVLPSMRSLQFGGKPIEISPNRIFNCAYLPIDDYQAFSEIMFLLLGGSGVGYSVQKHHVEKLPEIRKPRQDRKRRFLIGDSIEGWADSIKVLIRSYFEGLSTPEFDFSDIRQKGLPLITSGGKAPGPQPLKDCIHNIIKVLDSVENGTQLSSINCHDIICYIADAVLSGGIRRSALISLFSIDDEEMLTCKYGNWWEQNPQRARANNSAMALRHKISEEDFISLWDKIEKSHSGEPGILFSNDKEWGTNPCQPGSAPVLTSKGIREFRELKIGDLIWSESGWTKVINKASSGYKEVYKYRTTAGVFYGTSNHRVINNGEKLEVGSSDSIDILVGEYNVGVIHEYDIQDIMDGIVFGDGSVHKASNNLIYLCVGQDDNDYFDSEISSLIKEYRPGLAEYAYEIETSIMPHELDYTYKRIVPPRFFYGDRNKVCGFLRGLFTANGSICGERITLKASSATVIEQVQVMLSSIGIRSYFTTNKKSKIKWHNGEYESKESYDLNITIDRSKFLNSVGFIQKYKIDKIKDVISKITKIGRIKNTYDIVSEEFISKEEVFDITVDNESHTYWTGSCNVSNCCEIGLKNCQFCNLTEINASNIESQTDFNERSRAAAFIGTLQASYTNFHYLRDIWRKTTEKEALLGVGLTGICSGKILNLNIKEAAKEALKENERVSKLININKSARILTVKPSGTSSLVVGSSSGVHAWFDKYYIRRLRVGKNEPIYKYLAENHPELVEDEYFKPTIQAVISVPQKAPSEAIFRFEDVIDMLERVKKFNLEWVKEGHRSGANKHNVSATIYIGDNDWQRVGQWLWENRDSYNGLSVLPYDGGTYVQAPFESIDEDRYNELVKVLKKIDITKITEEEDNTELKEQVACSSGACDI